MAFKQKTRQRIIDGYLAATGRNLFQPREFVEWLADKPDHEAYPIIFAKSDGEAALEYRIDIARRMAAGLRVTVTHSETVNRVVQVTTREYPAYVSPMAHRRGGGGYQPFSEEDHMAELRAQGRVALRGWLERYRGAFEADGVGLSGVEALATEPVADEAAA
jgi:hypothetical protein